MDWWLQAQRFGFKFDPTDWWLQAQRFGFKFDPTDVQLVAYLYAKFQRWNGIWDLIGISDQVYTKPPWAYYSCTAFPGGEKYFCFTKLKKMNQNQNRVARTVGSDGTWHGSNRNKILAGNNYSNKRIIGFKRLLNFKVNGEGTDWLMHEFSLPGKDTDLVLCVIQKTQKKKQKEEEMGSNYETYLELFRGCGIEMVSLPDLVSTTSAGGDPCPGPVPAHDDHVELQALDSEEEETRPSKKMRSDPKVDDEPFSGADPCPAPAHDDDFEVSKSTASAGGAPCPVSGGVPCPAPAPAPTHDDHFELQVLDSEEEETRPSKKMRSDTKLVDHPVSVASSSVVDLPQDYWDNFAVDLIGGVPDLGEDESGLLDFSGLRDDLRDLPNAVFDSPGDDLFVFQAPPFEGNS